MNQTSPDDTNATDNQPTLKTGDTVTGVISTISSGVGFVSLADLEDDIVIPRGQTNHALDEDVVKIKLHEKEDGERRTGEVIEIIEKAKREFVGTMNRGDDGSFILSPDSRAMYVDIRLEASDEAKDGYKAQVLVTDWPEDAEQPTGRIKHVLGQKGDHEAEMQSILLDKGIIEDFPAEVEQEADEFEDWELTQDEIDKRRDMRGIPTCTIDPESAKDFDDALSFKELDNGNYQIGVHIADVSHFVRPNTAIDKEARERAFSVYLVDRTIPMLPGILSTDLCSLNPEVDRLAFSGVFEITPEAEVVDRWYGKTVIHSDKRFAYEDAQNVIDSGESEFAESLQIMNTIAKKFRKRRFSEGAIDFHSEEVKFVLDENKKPIAIEEKPRYDTHKMIEEYMLICNREVATAINDMITNEGVKHPFIYRVHGLPDRERIEELGVFLRALGYDFELDDGQKVSNADINALLARVEGKAEEGMVNTALIRSMDKAKYTIANKGHFGLSFQYYTHFTSPIRRYPDLLVHRLLYKHLHDQQVSPQELEFYQASAKHASEIEREVLSAERESIKYKQVEYLKEHVGEEFDAVVSGVSKYGIYVEEETTKAHGMVNVRNMDDDYYSLDEKQYALVGQNSGNKYTLGDEVRVKLIDANLDEKQLDFKLVDGDSSE